MANSALGRPERCAWTAGLVGRLKGTTEPSAEAPGTQATGMSPIPKEIRELMMPLPTPGFRRGLP